MSEEFDIYEEYGKDRIRGDQLFDIAADLLAACEMAVANDRVVALMDRFAPGVLVTMRAAIAKAKGDPR